MLTFVKVDFAKAFVSRLATSNDTKATILGLIAGGLLAANLNWALLLKGDSTQIGQAVGAVVAVLLGYYTNKKDKPQ